MSGPSPTGRRPELLVICGPTATGKTEAAIRISGELGGEIVSADAVQIYKGLDIGSAKPTAEERAAAPHHLLDIVEPTEVFSAARYVQEADRAIADIRGRGLLPVVTGGCGLYIRALLYGLCPAPPANPALRAALLAEEEQLGAGHLHRRLAAVDPIAAARLHPSDLVRVVRALEVQTLTGVPISERQASHGFENPRYEALIWGIDPGREVLHTRIEARVGDMVAHGLVEEVRGLLERGLAPGCPGLQTPGYREIVTHLEGLIELPEAIRLIGQAHRRYARRQRTWFRKTRGIIWHRAADELPVSLGQKGWGNP
ncbi:MAG: tRNA (adenosine(37)-N6)-dimethylallyltransferase MiaA [Polyangia bacterium]|jgi:tRNA dimethylallyltransferase|nr:tRNA (adenosine(37)-N6)-dimethylallyltransferase MiaA [Polyangia bacterium]